MSARSVSKSAKAQKKVEKETEATQHAQRIMRFEHRASSMYKKRMNMCTC